VQYNKKIQKKSKNHVRERANSRHSKHFFEQIEPIYVYPNYSTGFLNFLWE